MKEGMTINFNSPIINNGGTINGDIVNPVFNFGKPDATQMRKAALLYVESSISKQVEEGAGNKKLLFLPYVAAIRVDLMSNTLSVNDFNDKYGTTVSQSTFSEYVPKDITKSKVSELDSAAFESELRTMLNQPI